MECNNSNENLFNRILRSTSSFLSVFWILTGFFLNYNKIKHEDLSNFFQIFRRCIMLLKWTENFREISPLAKNVQKLYKKQQQKNNKRIFKIRGKKWAKMTIYSSPDITYVHWEKLQTERGSLSKTLTAIVMAWNQTTDK